MPRGCSRGGRALVSEGQIVDGTTAERAWSARAAWAPSTRRRTRASPAATRSRCCGAIPLRQPRGSGPLRPRGPDHVAAAAPQRRAGDRPQLRPADGTVDLGHGVPVRRQPGGVGWRATGALAAPAVVDYPSIRLPPGSAAAHARGIVHRDLKPDNVDLVPVEGRGGRPCQAMPRFRDLEGDRGSRDAGSRRRSAARRKYMAPEQVSRVGTGDVERPRPTSTRWR